MDAKTLEALKGSIAEKWEPIERGEAIDRGPNNCPLCKLFNPPDSLSASDCLGCPVFEKTGEKYCHDTPHDAWCDHQDRKHTFDPMQVNCPECVRLAQAELDFLKSLLPEETK